MDYKNLVLGALLAFFGALTFGNAPYTLTGYGLGTFCLLVIAFMLPPNEAYISFIVGNTLGLALATFSGSLFLLVVVGAFIFRLVQAIILIEVKKRHGLIAGAFSSISVFAIVAFLIGIYFYGGDGSFTAVAMMDVIYIAPAYLMYYTQQSELTDQHKIVHYVLILTATISMFLSLSTFIVPLPLVLGAILLVVLVFVSKSSRFTSLKNLDLKPVQTGVISVVIVGVFLVTFVLSGPVSYYAVGTVLYPLEPQSLTNSQWTQTHTDNTVCNAYGKNVAGQGTEENGVWGVERLRMVDPCVTVSGTVEIVYNVTGANVDGDFYFDVQLDSSYTYMLSFGSYAIMNGTIHVEVVPSDQPTVLSNLTLKGGQHVQVTGSWVLDTDHGWYSEIHPAMDIKVLST